MTEHYAVLDGIVLDDELTLTLGELCNLCDTSAERIMEMVDEGIVVPLGSEPRRWHFRGTSVRRVQIAIRLTRELRVNMAGAALALELLDELSALRQLSAGGA